MSKNLPNMLDATIEKIRQMVDVNSVVGDPIMAAEGVTIQAICAGQTEKREIQLKSGGKLVIN